MKLNIDGSVRISPSELKDADMCLRRYRYKYIKGIKMQTSVKPGLAVGSVLHKVLDRVLDGEAIPCEEIFKQEWATYKQANANGWKVQEELGEVPESVFAVRGAQLAQNIAAYFHGHDIVDTEKHLIHKIDRYYEIHGYVDIIHKIGNALHFGDWKFGTTKKSAGDIIQFWYQFVGYKIMAQSYFDTAPIMFMHAGSVSQAMKPKANFNYEPIPVVLPYEKMETEFVDRFKNLVDLVMKAAEDGSPNHHYPQTGRSNGVCSYCDYAGICSGIVTEESFETNPEPIMPVTEETK